MANQYVAWVNTETNLAYFNPRGLFEVKIGDAVHSSIAVAVGDLDAIQSVVDSINATLPQAPTFGLS